MSAATAEKIAYGLLIFALAVVVVLIVGGLVFAFLAIPAAVLMFAWNAAMPAIFGLPLLSFWSAFGLSVLLNIISARLGLPAIAQHFQRMLAELQQYKQARTAE